MVDVTTSIEVDGGLERNGCGNVTLGLSVDKLLHCDVEVRDVRLMVLLVMIQTLKLLDFLTMSLKII